MITALYLCSHCIIHIQEFINQHTEPYYDNYHGYWIGLSEKQGDTWVWTNGAQLEKG